MKLFTRVTLAVCGLFMIALNAGPLVAAGALLVLCAAIEYTPSPRADK